MFGIPVGLGCWKKTCLSLNLSVATCWWCDPVEVILPLMVFSSTRWNRSIGHGKMESGIQMHGLNGTWIFSLSALPTLRARLFPWAANPVGCTNSSLQPPVPSAPRPTDSTRNSQSLWGCCPGLTGGPQLVRNVKTRAVSCHLTSK